MKSKWLLATVLLVACLAVGVLILSGSTDSLPAVLVVVGTAVAAHYAVRWGSSKARKNEEAMQELLSKKARKGPTPEGK